MSNRNIFPEFTLATKEKHGFCCCNTSQTEAFIVIGVTAVLTGILWRSTVVAPIKLVAVFLHEFSHALAAWLTCGSVKGMEVRNYHAFSSCPGKIECKVTRKFCGYFLSGERKLWRSDQNGRRHSLGYVVSWLHWLCHMGFLFHYHDLGQASN